MDCGEHRHFADRAYMSYRVRTPQVLRQTVAPSCLADVEVLGAVGIHTTGRLRASRLGRGEFELAQLRASTEKLPAFSRKVLTINHEEWRNLHWHVGSTPHTLHKAARWVNYETQRDRGIDLEGNG